MSIVAEKVGIQKVAMGAIGYAAPPVMLETLLGSCVGVVLWDRMLCRSGPAALFNTALSFLAGHSDVFFSAETPGEALAALAERVAATSDVSAAPVACGPPVERAAIELRRAAHARALFEGPPRG